MPVTDPLTITVQKIHRACDECRSRKLACSKESDGCSRCKKESLTCVYSEQKQMGRPRKRKRTEVDNEAPAQVPEKQQPDVADFDFSLLNEDFGTFEDDFSFDNVFFDDPSAYGQYPPLGMPCAQFSDATENYLESGLTVGAATATDDGTGVVWHFGIDALPRGPVDLSWGSSEPSPSNESSGNSSTPDLALPLSSTAENRTVPDPEQEISDSRETDRAVECSCLSSLFLALASLQTLPADVVAAMRTIREASYTAKNVLHCKICGNCSITEYLPPIKALQNRMLLGTLLPVIVDGYKRLLKMVDDRHDSAVMSGSKILFRPSDYGINKTILSETCRPCLNWEMEVQPVDWRTSVRAFLRADVYGHEDNEGLKGLIKEMETQQRKRHDEVDALREAGLLQLMDHKLCMGEKVEQDNRTCERILDLARVAMEGLVIA